MQASKRRRFSTSSSLRSGGIVATSLALALIGCARGSGKSTAAPGQPAPTTPTTRDIADRGGVVIPAGSLPKLAPGANRVKLPDGNLLNITRIGGVPYFVVEGTFADASYRSILASSDAASLPSAEKNERLAREIAAVLKSVGAATRTLDVHVVPEVGYFSFLMPYEEFSSLAALKDINRTVLVNPVLASGESHASVKKLSADLNADLAEAGALSGDTAGYSGLLRIGIKEFESLVARDVSGAKVDGSAVRVGVTDTGVTFNHPAFTDAQGNSRIEYMTEFTGEGTLYFVDGADFQVRTPTKAELAEDPSLVDALFVTAKYLAPGGPGQPPVADDYQELKDSKILVSSELRRLLTQPGNGARLAILSEAAFANPTALEFSDINANGKTDDAMIVIHVPGAKGETGKLYVDLAGNGDMRRVKGVGDFNATKATLKAFSERIGFDMRPTKLVAKDGETEVDALQAGIVGYDPGNHGSHVTGIIGGRKTISNDSEGTYARGVAPASRLMVSRVCSNNGGCGATAAFIDLSLAGAEIINMSLGGLSAFNDGYGVQETIINRLTLENGTLFVISAGNSGPGRQTVGSPSTARLSLSVGASASRSLIQTQYQWPGSSKPTEAKDSDDNEFMLFFSSRGPTAAGGFKPNLAAPGTELSTIQLNAAPGARAGLDVYWGTSMSAPTAAGAAALLLDAAKKYNAANPATPLPVDALTLRGVLIKSSQGFDVAKLDTRTGESSKGRYTWIDQGNGLLNLARAWELLKAQRDVRAPASVVAKSSDKAGVALESVPLDYEVRVLAKLPNGLDYTGTTPRPSAGAVDPESGFLVPGFARGLWIDADAAATLHTVQIARRLPAGYLKRPDAGELMRQLNTSAETFALETTVHGSDIAWLRAGVLNQLDCKGAPVQSTVRILGEGAVDAFNADGTGTSLGLNASNILVCTDAAALKALPPGDHGAIIKAYRVADGKKEAIPAFEIPVYVTKAHKTLAGSERYEVSGVARSFDVERNYVLVPEGTSVVNVSLEVPERKADGSGCAGVELMAYEAGNTARPSEIAPRPKAIASNCLLGGEAGGSRVISYSRANPKAGVWDLHVFGRYQFDKSPYTLKVDYATVVITAKKLVGLPAILNGSFSLTVKETTFEATPDAAKSTFSLSSLTQTSRPEIAQDARLDVPNSEGQIARTFDATVKTVTFKTYGAPGSDLDLEVFECEDAGLEKCAQVASSGGATDVEQATVTPKTDKFYKAVVVGYEVASGKSEFTFKESLALAELDKGTLSMAPGAAKAETIVTHAFDVGASAILNDARFTSGKYQAGGELVLRTAGGNEVARIPVSVSAKDDTSTSSAGR
jgi:hypothetical protein